VIKVEFASIASALLDIRVVLLRVVFGESHHVARDGIGIGQDERHHRGLISSLNSKVMAATVRRRLSSYTGSRGTSQRKSMFRRKLSQSLRANGSSTIRTHLAADDRSSCLNSIPYVEMEKDQ
jgi:hypothetical protein